MSPTTIPLSTDATSFRRGDIVRRLVAFALLGVALSGWGVVLWHNGSPTLVSAEVEGASLEQQESLTHERRAMVAQANPEQQEQFVQPAVWHAARITTNQLQQARGEQPVPAVPADRVTQFVE